MIISQMVTVPRKETPTILQEIGELKTVHVSGEVSQDRKPLEDTGLARCLDPVEEVYCALVLGTKDYLDKTGFSKALIGLSGGVDSALTAAVAVDALGPENVVGIAMPSRYSSEGSISDAKELANNLGMELWEVPIEPAHTWIATNPTWSFTWPPKRRSANPDRHPR